MSFRHVLLPLDGSPLSAAAFPTAQSLARRFGAQLVGISVAGAERDTERLRARVEESLEAERLTFETPAVAVDVDVVVADDPAEVITARAAELGDGIVCMSTTGRGRVSGAFIGSTARAVLQSCLSPIVAVGPQADRPPMLTGRPPRRPRSWPEPLSIPRLVACVDGTPASEDLLPIAAEWGTSLEMDVTVLTIAEDSAPTASGERRNGFGPADPQGYVDELATRWREAMPGIAGEVRFDPISPAAGVVAHLKAEPAGLVAVTTHARSGLERLRLGATAADIVRTSPVPALVLPVPDD